MSVGSFVTFAASPIFSLFSKDRGKDNASLGSLIKFSMIYKNGVVALRKSFLYNRAYVVPHAKADDISYGNLFSSLGYGQCSGI